MLNLAQILFQHPLNMPLSMQLVRLPVTQMINLLTLYVSSVRVPTLYAHKATLFWDIISPPLFPRLYSLPGMRTFCTVVWKHWQWGWTDTVKMLSRLLSSSKTTPRSSAAQYLYMSMLVTHIELKEIRRLCGFTLYSLQVVKLSYCLVQRLFLQYKFIIGGESILSWSTLAPRPWGCQETDEELLWNAQLWAQRHYREWCQASWGRCFRQLTSNSKSKTTEEHRLTWSNFTL